LTQGSLTTPHADWDNWRLGLDLRPSKNIVRSLSMKFSPIIGVVAAVLVTGAFAAQQAATVKAVAEVTPAPLVALADNKPAKPGDATRGQTKAGSCAACHGADGNAADPQYPKLAGQHELYIARHLALFQNGGRENAIMMGMAAALNAQDMRDVGAYFASQKVLAGIGDDSVITEGPNQGKKYYQLGERIYRGGKADGTPSCIACHGPTGRGIPGPTYPAIGGQHASYTAAKLGAFKAGTIWGKDEQANAVMKAAAKNLSDDEIQGLATYLQGLHNAADAKVAAAK
jgi:cytochrome c553